MTVKYIAVGMGNYLKETRLNHGMTIRDLAEKTGVSVASICDIENYKQNTTINTLSKICDGLGLCVQIGIEPKEE